MTIRTFINEEIKRILSEETHTFSTHDVHPEDKLPVTSGHFFRVKNVGGKNGTFKTVKEPAGNMIKAVKVSDSLEPHSRTKR
jgi:hypothetical protein